MTEAVLPVSKEATMSDVKPVGSSCTFCRPCLPVPCCALQIGIMREFFSSALGRYFGSLGEPCHCAACVLTSASCAFSKVLVRPAIARRVSGDSLAFVRSARSLDPISTHTPQQVPVHANLLSSPIRTRSGRLAPLPALRCWPFLPEGVLARTVFSATPTKCLVRVYFADAVTGGPGLCGARCFFRLLTL